MSDASAADLARAAAVLVQTVVKLRADESFVIVADEATDDIGHALRRAGEAAGATVTLLRLDLVRSLATNSTGERPHKVLPDAVRRALQAARASCYIASAPHQEVSMREQMTHLLATYGVRHCHMPGVTARGFVAGFKLGYDKVASWGHGLRKLLELAHSLESESAAGTKLHVELAPRAKWSEKLGEAHPGQCVTLPAGALYTSPERINGAFVANASVGEFFGARAGLLLRSPVRFTIAEGRVTSVEAPQGADLERDVRAMLAVAPNSDRVGMVVVGVNMGVEAPTGDASVDQNLPGLHLVFGDPSGKDTGATWTARTQFVGCQSAGRVSIDGTVAIVNARIVSVL
jgi:aminopeptidase